MTTATKTIQFDQLMKVMKNFVFKSETRPALQFVNFDGKYLVATDSHQLLRVNAEYVSGIPENLTLFDPKEMKIITEQMKYPDTSRLIPDSLYTNSTVTIDGNIKEFMEHVKEIKKVVKSVPTKTINLNFKHNETTVSGTFEENTYSATMNTMYVEGQEIALQCNANYLYNVLEVTKKLSKLSYEPVKIEMYNRMRPIQIKQNNVFDLLVLPVRTV
jgi:hypothetical protein